MQHYNLQAAVDGNIGPGIIYISGGIVNKIGLLKRNEPETALITIKIQTGALRNFLRI